MVAADPMSNSPPPVQRTSSGPAMLRNSSVMVPTPTPDNHYLGFCKNAVRLQNGDRGAFEKHNEHAYSRSDYSSVTIQYLACRSAKCSFMGQLKADKIWERVWKDEPLGLKWRWAFLAKSHVQQKQVKGQQFAYQCIFCTFATGKGAVYHSTRMYMEHVATHRGEMSEVLKYKTGCLNDRICNDEEEFDINLFPLDGQENRDRQASQCLSDDLQGLAIFPPKPEPADSMFGANEPWNEGLSNFHYRSDLDPTELE